MGQRKIKPLKEFSEFRVYGLRITHKILVEGFNKRRMRMGYEREIFHGLQISLETPLKVQKLSCFMEILGGNRPLPYKSQPKEYKPGYC
jgi:hypothetical protein